MSICSGRLTFASCLGFDASVSRVRCTLGSVHMERLYSQPNWAWCLTSRSVAPSGSALRATSCVVLMSIGYMCAFGKYLSHEATEGAVSSPMPISRIDSTAPRIEPKIDCASSLTAQLGGQAFAEGRARVSVASAEAHSSILRLDGIARPRGRARRARERREGCVQALCGARSAGARRGARALFPLSSLAGSLPPHPCARSLL
eukprot:scaffold121212_cov33-Tisochrysis_lutea.AAC.1